MNYNQAAIPSVPPLLEITGVIERITFQNEENGFTVARLMESGKGRDVTTVVGFLAGAPVGSTLSICGNWQTDKRFGPQFNAVSYRILKPNTLNGIERYLGSGLIKGVGPKFAARIARHFGLATMEVLDSQPDRLSEIPGLGRKRIEQIKASWSELHEIHDVMVFLQGHGISATYAIKIFKAYGRGALTVVQNNPYRLSEDIWGIGFKIADRIARSLGISEDDPRRARAGLLFALDKATDDGHCCMQRQELFKSAGELLLVPESTMQAQLSGLIADERIVLEKDRVYPIRLYFAEVGVAKSLVYIGRGTPDYSCRDIDKTLAGAFSAMKLTVAPEQAAAVKMALTYRASIITGGPGTGKSTILKALFHILGPRKVKIKLAAPTGRAAKRLGQACDCEAKTIHRLLEYDPSIRGFKRNGDSPLDADLVVIDEVSMMDIFLADSLLKAIPAGCSVLLVGDANQLPSVGPGNVLKDLIKSGRIPVTELTKIFRQGEGSLISLNAARINLGETLELMPGYKGEKDFYFIKRETPEKIEEEIVSLCTTRLSRKYGFDPKRDIQLITPMRKGIIGVDNLNRRLQEYFDADRRSRRSVSKKAATGAMGRFVVGDKVMQIRNNYDKDVFNGDQGFVDSVDIENHTMEIDFEGRGVIYESNDLSELDLAYAVTVHKSQGSEFSCVVIPLHTAHYPMLQRNLIYTAITRGKRLVVVVGSPKALAMAVRNNKVMQRNTRLAERIVNAGL